MFTLLPALLPKDRFNRRLRSQTFSDNDCPFVCSIRQQSSAAQSNVPLGTGGITSSSSGVCWIRAGTLALNLCACMRYLFLLDLLLCPVSTASRCVNSPAEGSTDRFGVQWRMVCLWWALLWTSSNQHLR